MRAIGAYSKCREIILANNNENEEQSHLDNEEALIALNCHCALLAGKVKKARQVVTEIQNKLKGIQMAKGKKEHSVESKMFAC
jgi:hypothetical protein